MRIRTELSEQPPVFAVSREGGEAVIRFYTDVTEYEREGMPVWETVEWSIRRPWSDTLEERIAANAEAWLLSIQQTTEAEEQAEEQARMAAESERLDKLAAQIAFVTLAENETLDETTATEHYNLFAEWEPSVAYKSGAIRRRGDDLYKCIQAHTSQVGWEPESVPAIWRPIGNPADEFPEWSQPICAEDAYAAGDKVTYGGKRWVSTANANVWAPGVYGWTEVEADA